ncbi:MAG: glycosyltransferase, partial [Arachnia sp.]
DYHAALRESDLFVTNGGYTGVTLALAAGVPVLQAGATEEKADIGARLKWAGVGASVRRTRPSVAQLRHAARKLMESSARRRASRDLALEMSTYDAAELGAGLVGQLVGVQQR